MNNTRPIRSSFESRKEAILQGRSAAASSRENNPVGQPQLHRRGARTSLVAKSRASSYAVLDVRWSTRRVRAGGGALAASCSWRGGVSVVVAQCAHPLVVAPSCVVLRRAGHPARHVGRSGGCATVLRRAE